MERSVEEGEVVPGRAASQSIPCRWLVALDYDGTLRCHEGSPVPEDFLQLMRAARPYGVRWGINTGRSLGYLCEELLPCLRDLPDFICTTERFAYLADADGRVSPAADFNRVSYEANATLRRSLSPALTAEMARIRRLHPEWEWCFAPNDPLSVQAQDSATMDGIAPLLQPFVDALPGVAMQRASRFMRLSDSRYNKATALEYVMDCWHISPEQLFVMGDGHNDLDVFRRFPTAFRACPADAHPDIGAWLRENGGYVSSSPGVMEMLVFWLQNIVAPAEGRKCQQMSVSA